MKHKPIQYYKGNTLKQLRAFCSVARTGKMTDAADEMFLSQSAISLQIKALEEEMDAVLFERRGPRIQLTPDGRKLLDMVRPIVEGMDGLKERFDKEIRGNLEAGKVVIAAGESTIMYILPQLLSTYREKYPKIQVELHNVTGRDGLAMLRQDEVDFAVGSILDVPSDISYDPLYTPTATMLSAINEIPAICPGLARLVESLSPMNGLFDACRGVEAPTSTRAGSRPFVRPVDKRLVATAL